LVVCVAGIVDEIGDASVVIGVVVGGSRDVGIWC